MHGADDYYYNVRVGIGAGTGEASMPKGKSTGRVPITNDVAVFMLVYLFIMYG